MECAECEAEVSSKRHPKLRGANDNISGNDDLQTTSYEGLRCLAQRSLCKESNALACGIDTTCLGYKLVDWPDVICPFDVLRMQQPSYGPRLSEQIHALFHRLPSDGARPATTPSVDLAGAPSTRVASGPCIVTVRFHLRVRCLPRLPQQTGPTVACLLQVTVSGPRRQA